MYERVVFSLSRDASSRIAMELVVDLDLGFSE